MWGDVLTHSFCDSVIFWESVVWQENSSSDASVPCTGNVAWAELLCAVGKISMSGWYHGLVQLFLVSLVSPSTAMSQGEKSFFHLTLLAEDVTVFWPCY